MQDAKLLSSFSRLTNSEICPKSHSCDSRAKIPNGGSLVPEPLSFNTYDMASRDFEVILKAFALHYFDI